MTRSVIYYGSGTSEPTDAVKSDIFSWAQNVFQKLYNELRIDAAEREKDRGKGQYAAASVRVGLSRTPNPTATGLGSKAAPAAQEINRGNRWLVQ